MVQIRAERETQKVRTRKREILRAASTEFRARGFRDASMREIAAALSMTVGNLYYYFESKQALLAFCQEETLNRLHGLLDDAQAEDLSLEDRLYWIIVGHVRCVTEELPGALAHLTIDPLPEPIRARCIARRDRYEARLRSLVRTGIASKRFRDIDPKLSILTILGAVNGTVHWFRPEGSVSPIALGRAMAEQLVRGLTHPAHPWLAPQSDPPSFVTSLGDAVSDSESDEARA